MIRIEKPDLGPPILTDPTKRGPRTTQSLKDAYDAGQRDFEFESDIYGAKSVKNKLISLQHGKCCFCEARITHVSHGDVEHFRPKGGFVQIAEDALTKPGYYWLAYDWDNLFLSCQICNQRHKKNLFPLSNPTARALSHHDELYAESPLFLNPADDEPQDYIGFRDEYPFSIDDNERGAMTIQALGIDREELAATRRDRLADLRLLLLSYQSLPEGSLRNEIEDRLRELVEPTAEYSAMNASALAGVL